MFVLKVKIINLFGLLQKNVVYMSLVVQII